MSIRPRLSLQLMNMRGFGRASFCRRALNFGVVSFVVVRASALALAGCAAALPANGPSRNSIEANSHQIAVVKLADLDLASLKRSEAKFSEVFESAGPVHYTLSPGDVVEVTVWEAPPQMLFGTTGADSRSSGPSRGVNFPEQAVSSTGTVSVPFAGLIAVEGKSLSEIESAIVDRLRGKANHPQVLVRLVRNTSLNVTVVGEVAASQRVPLTPRGERLLDALAAVGGVRQPIHRTSIQIVRNGKAATLPLEAIIQDPKQNITLRGGDVITALHQPLSLTVLGAVAKSEELSFEAQGITLAQALGRIGGLLDQRADAAGVYIFRVEQAEVDSQKAPPPNTRGEVPIVYTIDLKDPSSFFIAQRFKMRHKDVLYVANAQSNELQKFLNLIGSVIYPLDVINRVRQ